MKIQRDESFWETIMVPKLTLYYMECVLPELVDPRIPGSMKIKEPSFILQAIRSQVSHNYAKIAIHIIFIIIKSYYYYLLSFLLKA